MRNTFLSFLLIVFFSISAKANISNYKFEQITPVSGISFSGVLTIEEDKNGFIWTGGGFGLYFYDGISFKHYYKGLSERYKLPSNNILKISRDSDDVLWFCTSNGLAYYDSINDSFNSVDLFRGEYVFDISEIASGEYLVNSAGLLYVYHSKKNSRTKFQQISSPVTAFNLRTTGELIIGTAKGELLLVNISEKRKCNLIYKHKNDKITSICYDNGWIYVGYENSGIDVVDLHGDRINSYATNSVKAKYQLPNNKIRKIVKRNNGEIWVATYDGIAVLSPDGVTVFNNINSNINSSSIYDIFIDSHECVWVGTWSGGISRYSPDNYSFDGECYYNTKDTKFGVVTAFSSSFLPGCVWVGTENNGLYLYDFVNRNFVKRYFPLQIHIKAIYRHNDRVFIGAVEGMYELNEKTGEITNIHIKSFDSLGEPPIISCLFVKDDVLYISTRSSGIVEYNLTNLEEKLYYKNNKGISINAVWQIFVDDHKNIYACTNKGLAVKTRSQDSFVDVLNEDNLLFYSITSFNHSDLLLGTRNNGIYVYNTRNGNLKPFFYNEQLIGNDIYSLNVDENGEIWASTNSGIVKINAESSIINRYSETDGVVGQQFHPLASYMNTDGTIFWGSTIGFNFINVKDIKRNTIKPVVLPVSIKVNNNDLSKYDLVKVNSKHVPDIRQIELPYNLNTLSIKVATNNLIDPVKNVIKYMMEGYENDWTTIKQTDNIVFTQLPPGKYVLRVLGTNNDLLWGEKELMITIKILPPFYATAWAYTVYSVILLLVVIIVYRNIRFRIKALQEISSERNQNKINKKVAEERTKFFMNISHELRTPLNLIVAPMKILRQKSFDKETMFNLDVIYRNTERLRHLTDQILDFRLLEMNKLQIKRKNVDIIPICKEIISEFNYYIMKNNVKLNFSSDAITRYVNCDPGMIEKVVYNIFSNALKYSNINPEINILIHKAKLEEDDFINIFFVGKKFLGQAVQIEISDNGLGIDSDRYEAVFERFSSFHDEHQIGSGIGLHLCKEYVLLHNGNIMLTSEMGKGSRFIVNLPLLSDDSTVVESSPIIISSTNSESQDSKIEEDFYSDEEYLSSSDVKTVLLADDNEEVIYYLKKSLSSRYRCLVAKNGKIAYDMATTVMPDIIVMDYMMPVMNGVDCTKAIKNNPKIKDIPVIILSGAVDSESQKKAINVGADVFLAKPIDEELLIGHISKLLDKVRNLDDISYSNKAPQVFIERIDYYLEKNITDPNFDVEKLSACMNISRSSLFRKIKAETGYNISEYIKEKRLKVAVDLIKKGQRNVEELSVCCGFNSSSYFCKCFKSKYGISPKEYIKLNS